MANILILEGNPEIRRSFNRALTSEGHCVMEASCLENFMVHANVADIAVIDVDLPKHEGYLAARHLHGQRPRAGVILLGEQADGAELIHGLRQFADQFLTKPITPELLGAHIAPMVRRLGDAGWRLDPLKRELQSPGGHRATLNHQEMCLMGLFATRPRASTVSRRDVVTALGYDWMDYDERRLDQMVSRLRRRWFNHTGAELPLHTERGTGYRISVPLRPA